MGERKGMPSGAETPLWEAPWVTNDTQVSPKVGPSGSARDWGPREEVDEGTAHKVGGVC